MTTRKNAQKRDGQERKSSVVVVQGKRQSWTRRGSECTKEQRGWRREEGSKQARQATAVVMGVSVKKDDQSGWTRRGK